MIHRSGRDGPGNTVHQDSRSFVAMSVAVAGVIVLVASMSVAAVVRREAQESKRFDQYGADGNCAQHRRACHRSVDHAS